MNRNFFIKDVEIKNFRGYSNQKFDFFKGKEDYRGLILLGGPNGYGKTSLLDAIEWCFTGSVHRLKKDFSTRRDSNNKLLKSLIRNNPSDMEVWVKINVLFNNEQLEIERLFNQTDESEAFYPQNSFFKADGNLIEENNTIDSIIGKPIATDFYERFTCSYEKNITIYEKNRTDIYAMFSSFLGGTKDIQVAIGNLDGGNANEGLISKLENKINSVHKPSYVILKDTYEKLETKLDALLKEKETSSDIAELISDYPKVKAFDDEMIPSMSLHGVGDDIEKKLIQFKKQNSSLMKLRFLKEYSTAYNESKTYKEDLGKEKTYNSFMERVYQPYHLKEEDIQSIQGKDLDTIKSEKRNLESIKINLMKFQDPTKNGASKLKELSQEIIDEDDAHLAFFVVVKSQFVTRESLSNQLEGFKTPDKALQALRLLVDHTEGFEKHREKEHNACPLCGSEENFPDKELELAKVARDVLGVVDGKRADLQKEFDDCDTELKETYKTFYEYLLDKIEKALFELIKVINNFTNLQSYISGCVSFSIDINQLTQSLLEEKKEEFKNQLKETLVLATLETSILEQLVNEQGFLMAITSHHNQEQQVRIPEFKAFNIVDKINGLTQFIDYYQDILGNTTTDNVFNDMKIELLVGKITTLDKLIQLVENDKEIQNISSEIKEQKELFKESDKIYTRSKMELVEFKRISRDLKGLRVQWDKDRVSEIKEPLQKIYKRINRHTNIKDINLVIEGRTNKIAGLWANTKEDEKIFAPNILSAGQLSVVALSIFISVALGQKESPFKCYFMDDPIQTMDDLNILSFIDLLRAELAPKNQLGNQFVDQLFFTTCDEKLERLISHKMKNFGVNFSHVHFTGYGNFEMKA
ncbi:AAA family ATPase [Sporosarcina sp. G11-34]|uniref:AAA family ATPase n=1 Tax=Sporosarcina sp. G11-34 TaxID=2849605 RepID=UPI0022A9E9AA|nr:AAA family ATPase [Sporosarcina sp. G11-34]MCZ2258077.1 AAA family ATPase [Sporosarcina sp. G11-34]